MLGILRKALETILVLRLFGLSIPCSSFQVLVIELRKRPGHGRPRPVHDIEEGVRDGWFWNMRDKVVFRRWFPLGAAPIRLLVNGPVNGVMLAHVDVEHVLGLRRLQECIQKSSERINFTTSGDQNQWRLAPIGRYGGSGLPSR